MAIRLFSIQPQAEIFLKYIFDGDLVRLSNDEDVRVAMLVSKQKMEIHVFSNDIQVPVSGQQFSAFITQVKAIQETCVSILKAVDASVNNELEKSEKQPKKEVQSIKQLERKDLEDFIDSGGSTNKSQKDDQIATVSKEPPAPTPVQSAVQNVVEHAQPSTHTPPQNQQPTQVYTPPHPQEYSSAPPNDPNYPSHYPAHHYPPPHQYMYMPPASPSISSAVPVQQSYQQIPYPPYPNPYNPNYNQPLPPHVQNSPSPAEALKERKGLDVPRLDSLHLRR